jgi:hypothetical protein
MLSGYLSDSSPWGDGGEGVASVAIPGEGEEIPYGKYEERVELLKSRTWRMRGECKL